MPAPIDTLDDLGRLIREARKRRGISQRQLAGLIGYAQSYTSDVETGAVADVGALLIGRLEAALGIPLELLSRAASARAERARSHGDLPSVEGDDITNADIAPLAGDGRGAA